MGYYSLIGLLRLNCLFGDYYSALRALDPIDLTKKVGLTKQRENHPSHISTEKEREREREREREKNK
jgi:hypothetical protein